MLGMAMFGSSGGGGGLAVLVVVYLALFVLYWASLWAIVAKAGRPGWEGIIPIYNLYVLLKIVGRPGWWLVLYIMPVVNIIIIIVVAIDLAKSFGFTGAFAVGLILLPIVFYPILGFGSSRYVGPAAAGGAAMLPPSPPGSLPPPPQ
jgi:hypothetical protein